jgi:hypothetical protein
MFGKIIMNVSKKFKMNLYLKTNFIFKRVFIIKKVESKLDKI